MTSLILTLQPVIVDIHDCYVYLNVAGTGELRLTCSEDLPDLVAILLTLPAVPLLLIVSSSILVLLPSIVYIIFFTEPDSFLCTVVASAATHS